MENLLKESDFSYVSDADKTFIVAFDGAMADLGYTSNNAIGDGYCWGRHMIIYTKTGVKSKKSYARIYMPEDHIILRMYFSGVDSKRDAIESAPDYIKAGFTGDYGRCGHCHNQREDGSCSHRKTYTIDRAEYEFFDGFAFWFFRPTVDQLPEYLKLFTAFYPMKRGK